MKDRGDVAETQVTVIARINAKPGMEQNVEEQLQTLLAPTQAERGCINFDMHHSLENPSHFLFHENWTSEANLRQHLGARHITE
jgi:quinol monooxygenase YgiN